MGIFNSCEYYLQKSTSWVEPHPVGKMFDVSHWYYSVSPTELFTFIAQIFGTAYTSSPWIEQIFLSHKEAFE